MACPVGFMVSVVCCGEALLVYPRSSTGRAATFIIFSQGAVIFSEAQNKDENQSVRSNLVPTGVALVLLGFVFFAAKQMEVSKLIFVNWLVDPSCSKTCTIKKITVLLPLMELTFFRGVGTQSTWAGIQPGFLSSLADNSIRLGEPGERCLPGRSENPVAAFEAWLSTSLFSSRRLKILWRNGPLAVPGRWLQPRVVVWTRLRSFAVGRLCPLWALQFSSASHGAPAPPPLRSVSGWCCSCQSRGKSGAHVSTYRVAPGSRDADTHPKAQTSGSALL